MNTTLRSLTVLATTALISVLVALPVLAAETPDEKSQMFARSPHSAVGAVILAVGAIFVVFAVGNAVNQLRGKRSQADGKFRWR